MQLSYRVNVFHTESKYSYELARALQKSKILNYLITSASYYGNPSHSNFTDLNTSSVIQYPWPKILSSAIKLIAPLARTKRQAILLASQIFDMHVSRHYVKDVDAVVGFSGASLTTFLEAKKKGIKCILNQPKVLVTSKHKILSEEAALHPDFAGTIDEDFGNWKWQHRQLEEVHLADMILCGSYFVKQSFDQEKLQAEKIRIVPYGVGTEEFLCHRNEDNFVKNHTIRILFAGKIGQRQGIKYLLEAVKQIGNKKIELTLVGDFYGPQGAYKPYVDWFRHIPHVPHHLMRNYYTEADLLVLPSVAEGFGLQVLEAMASGIPVIVSENTGAKDLIEDGKEGFVIPIRDVKTLKEKILYFYESPIKVLEMGERARKKAEHYSWLYYQGSIKSIFDQLFSKEK